MPDLAVRTLGSGPALVMVPGWAMHSGMWGEFAQALARHFTLILVDLPGHGCTPVWHSWDLADLMGELVALQRGVFWLGWSLGGQLLMELACRCPERVKGLVLLAANPRFVAGGDWPGMERQVFETFQRQLRQRPQATLRRFLGLITQGTPRPVGKKVRQLWQSCPPPRQAVLHQGLNLLGRLDLRSKSTGIRCPVAIIGGQGDALVPPEAVRRSAALFPQATITAVEAGGHVPFLVEPAPLADWIRQAFL